MSGALDIVQASWRAEDSAVVGVLGLQSYRRRVVTITIQGPGSSTLRIYRGLVIAPVFLINSVFPADDRFYDSVVGGAPSVVSAGEPWTFAWTGGKSGDGTDGTVSAATATITSEVIS